MVTHCAVMLSEHAAHATVLMLQKHECGEDASSGAGRQRLRVGNAFCSVARESRVRSRGWRAAHAFQEAARSEHEMCVF